MPPLARLEQLSQKPIPVDIESMRQEHAPIQSTLHKGLYIPKWLGISCLCLLVGFSLSVVSFNYKQYIKLKGEQTYIKELEVYTQKLKEKIPKSNTKR